MNAELTRALHGLTTLRTPRAQRLDTRKIDARSCSAADGGGVGGESLTERCRPPQCTRHLSTSLYFAKYPKEVTDD